MNTNESPQKTILNPKQVRDLEENYEKIKFLENEVKTIKENYLSKDEFQQLMKEISKSSLDTYNEAKKQARLNK